MLLIKTISPYFKYKHSSAAPEVIAVPQVAAITAKLRGLENTEAAGHAGDT